MIRKILSKNIWFMGVENFYFSYFFVIFLIVLLIVPSLLLIVVFSQSLNLFIAVKDSSWEQLFGPVLAPFFSSLFVHTSFEKGLSASFQKDYFPWILLSLGFVVFFFQVMISFLLENMALNFGKTLREKLTHWYLSLTYEEYVKFDISLLAVMIGSEINEISNIFSKVVGRIFQNILMSISYVIFLFIIDWKMTFLVILIIPPSALVLSLVQKYMKRYAKRGFSRQSELLSHLVEKFLGWQTIQSFQAQDFEQKSYEKTNHELYRAWKKATRVKAASSPLIKFLIVLLVVLLLLLAIRRFSDGLLNITTLSIFIFTFVKFGDSLQKLGNQITSSRRSRVALERVLEVLNSYKKGFIYHEVKKNFSLEKIVFEKVSYKVEDRILFHDFSYSFEKGSFYTLVGPSGCGKSTLFRLLLGLQEPMSGTILLNDKNLDSYSLYHLSSSIGFISQDIFLIPDSILKNIIYPLDSVSMIQRKKIENIMEKCKLTKPLESSVLNLSGGEKQRLAWARAMFHEPTLLLIDEGSSALDFENEEVMFRWAQEVAQKGLVISIAHRQSAWKYSSFVIDMLEFCPQTSS